MSRRAADEDYLIGDDLFGDEEPEEPGEPDEAAEGSGRAAARLADGSGFLITDGPGAGSLTDESTGPDIRDAPPLPGRDKALDGTLPLFIVHRPYRYCDAVPRLLAQLHAAAGGNLALGVSSFMHAASPASHTDWGSSCAAAAVRIIDPAGFIADPKDVRVKEPGARALGWAPHLAGGPVPVADLLDLQRERGANLLLTSGRALDHSEARDSAAAACDEGDDALAALKPGERLALNLTVSAEWLCRPALLNTLLTELIEKQQFDTWYIRVQWPSKPWTQPTGKDLLAGYRRLAQVADDEDRRLLLPQTGLTGWLMLAWGAAGFGTGPFSSNQAFLEPSDFGKQPTRAVLRAAAAPFRGAHQPPPDHRRPGLRRVHMPVLPAPARQDLGRVVAQVRRAPLPVQRGSAGGPDSPGRRRPPRPARRRREGGTGGGPVRGRQGAHREQRPVAPAYLGSAPVEEASAVPGPARRARYRAGAVQLRKPLPGLEADPEDPCRAGARHTGQALGWLSRAVGRKVRPRQRLAAGKGLTGNSDPVRLRAWDQLLQRGPGPARTPGLPDPISRRSSGVRRAARPGAHGEPGA